jgi:prepilin-type N-terminal cleavage/methylation domain-containing protein
MSSGIFQEQVAMRTFRRARAHQAFTLVELMIVCTMVAILALTATPMYTQYVTSAVISEGVAGTGAIRTAMRIYCSQHGSYAGANLNNLNIGSIDLEGKYFAQSDYSLTNVGASTYLIKAGPPSKSTQPNMPYYAIDQNGDELGTWVSHE